MALMSSRLPSLDRRKQLWKVFERGPAQVMLTPRGAIKEINNFKSFARTAGTSQEILIKAYEAASAAAAQQRGLGQLPFLVYASHGPDFGRSRFVVHTSPLGYSRQVKTEQVGAGVGGC